MVMSAQHPGKPALCSEKASSWRRLLGCRRVAHRITLNLFFVVVRCDLFQPVDNFRLSLENIRPVL
ncbi:hypothetical protein RA29_16720 [Tateyamaria sp. ANG-S1]|nr:hypothetical protein RA29_16720 [Tateyamaria sp. ANG-S1]